MNAPKTYLVASQRPWNAGLAARLEARTGARFLAAQSELDLTVQRLAALRPRYVFIAHWSSRIPDEVWSDNECVIFHMTDLPYGRGGSPLQNLIERGHDVTVISAIRCVRELDAGPVYLKRPLALHGSAEEIFLRADRIIEDMIVEIMRAEPAPVAQQGSPVTFKRRRPADSSLSAVAGLDRWYDMIRMLDADGYPRAYLDVGDLRIEFSNVSRRVNGLNANVVIRERPREGGS